MSNTLVYILNCFHRGLRISGNIIKPLKSIYREGCESVELKILGNLCCSLLAVAVLLQVSVLVMCHTRELAFQISKEYERFSKYMPTVKVKHIYNVCLIVPCSSTPVSQHVMHVCFACRWQCSSEGCLSRRTKRC